MPPVPIYEMGSSAYPTETSQLAYTEEKRKQLAKKHFWELDSDEGGSFSIIALLWIITLAGLVTSARYGIGLLLSSYGMPRAPIWLKISQPIISTLLFAGTSNTFARSFGLKHHQLSSTLLWLAPIAMLSTFILTSALFLVNCALQTLRYSAQAGKGYFAIIGVLEMVLCVCSVFWVFTTGNLAKSWVSAACSRPWLRDRLQLNNLSPTNRLQLNKTSACTRRIASVALWVTSHSAFGIMHYIWISIVLEPFIIHHSTRYNLQFCLPIFSFLLLAMTTDGYAHLLGVQPYHPNLIFAAAVGIFSSGWGMIHMITVAVAAYLNGSGLFLYGLAKVLVTVGLFVFWLHLDLAVNPVPWPAANKAEPALPTKIKSPLEDPEFPRGHISTANVISTIWVITCMSVFLVTWTLAAIIFEPFATVPAVPAWIIALQPFITLILGYLISDSLLAAAGIEPLLLPAMPVWITADAWFVMALYTTWLFLSRFVWTTIEHSQNEGKGAFVAVGIIEVLAVLAGWINFIRAGSEGHVFAKKWLDAAMQKEEKPWHKF